METIGTRQLVYPDSRDAMDLFVEAGLDPALVDKMRKSQGNAVARKMISVGRVGYEAPDERLARRIMGGSYFGREEWGDIYGVSLTSTQSRVAAKFPWTAELLDSECPANPGKAISQTHFAFLGIEKYNGAIISAQGEMCDGADAHGPLTIMSWQKIHPAGGQPSFYQYGSNCWYPNEDFANVALGFQWYLGLKDIVPGSTNTSWENMQGMIPAEYYTPLPITELTKDFMVYKKTGVYPNKNVYAATDVLHSGGGRVVVGSCDGEAVVVYGWSGCAGNDVGLGLFRK